MDRQKVVILLDSSELGGIETHIVHLALALRQSACDSEIWFYKRYSHTHPLEEKLKQKQINFRYLDGSFKHLRNLLNSEEPLILHSHGYKAAVMGRLAALLAGTPSVSTFHNGDKGSGIVRLYTLLDKLTSRLSSNIAVSEEIAKRLPKTPKVINNFINIRSAPCIQGRNIAFVGRLSHEKGPDLFIRIASQLPELTFRMIGGGPMEQELSSEPPPNVSLVGQVRDMETQWPEIGLLCISSREEGLPMVALEAMSRGIPVVAYRLGALPQLIQQNANGWIVPRENIQVMTKLIKHWSCLDAAHLDNMTQCCLKTIEKDYSYEAILPQIVSVYRHALSKKGLSWPIAHQSPCENPSITELRE
ncbi:glycosyltransferase family 4 protein [Endozoicomonas numazuensis]|uniref:glycosyltransferase family 4 protein n=1 Tax=Endozoicomonas numazuensis TaxID=1137799 RepID=UPI000689F351|nr:glycosyltransferase family 4 protein [Endozoicomonas numazuensis]